MLWDDLRFFLAVQRRGSHKGAARQLHVDPTTVARRIAALEGSLGAKLFVRTPERLLVTPAGSELAPYAERVEAEVLALERTLKAADRLLEGVLRVTAPDGLVHYVLLPALLGFQQDHPALTVDLRVDTAVLDLSRREADVAVRLGRPKQPALVARRLGTVKFALFASDGYLSRHGTPRGLGVLAAHGWVGFDALLDQQPQIKWLRRLVAEPRYAPRANTTAIQAQACAEGHGIALLPMYVAAHEPRLRRLLPRLVGPSRDLWAVTHSDMRTNARVEAFVDWLQHLMTNGTDALGMALSAAS